MGGLKFWDGSDGVGGERSDEDEEVSGEEEGEEDRNVKRAGAAVHDDSDDETEFVHYSRDGQY